LPIGAFIGRLLIAAWSIQDCGIAAMRHLRQLNASLTQWTNHPMDAPIWQLAIGNGRHQRSIRQVVVA
jgi:hypothetical protein